MQIPGWPKEAAGGPPRSAWTTIDGQHVGRSAMPHGPLGSFLFAPCGAVQQVCKVHFTASMLDDFAALECGQQIG